MNRKERRANKARAAKLEAAKLRAMNVSDKGIPYTIRTLEGQPFWEAAAIFPIFTNYEPDKSKLVGTGFYITRFGHFLTAQHVLMELHDKQKNGFMIHMLDDDISAIVRNITVFSCHPSADVALGALEHPPGTSSTPSPGSPQNVQKSASKLLRLHTAKKRELTHPRVNY
jgi:hypothetical protein